MNNAEPICALPIIMKNRIETFFMFWIVSIGVDYTLRFLLMPCLVWCKILSMKISKDTVKHVANLARLGITEDEAVKFSGQLSAVFEYMDILQEVDISDVAETSQVTGLENVKDFDEIGKWTASGEEVKREDLLGCTELPVESGQILVKAAVKKQ